MVTNDGNNKITDDLLSQYNQIHDCNVKIKPEIQDFLDRNRDKLAHPVYVPINGENSNLLKITTLDLMINVLGCIVVKAGTIDSQKISTASPIFNPSTMLEDCKWSPPNPPYMLVELKLYNGLCSNLAINLAQHWDRNPDNFKLVFNTFVAMCSAVVCTIAQHWEFYSGNSQYPVPEFRNQDFRQPARKTAMLMYSSLNSNWRNMYKGEYGSLRIELAKFILDQLIVYRMVRAA